MRIVGYLGLFAWALPLAANSITVTSATSALLHTGDELVFTVSSYGFGVNAAQLGMASSPARVGFEFVSDALASGAVFDATLVSRDGSASAEFSQGTFRPGQFQGTYYSGAVSVLSGSMSLTAALSQELFAGSSAILTLKNVGPDVTVGLAPYTLAQSLSVSLSAGGFSTGAPPVMVLMEQQGASAPEPGSLVLLTFVGLLALLWTGMNRVSPRRIQYVWRHFAPSVCKPLGLSGTI